MAYYLNRSMIIGNLTRDPESKQLPSGQSVCNFSIATNRAFSDKEGNQREEVEFHNCVAWGKLAEICQQYLGKGRKVYVDGRMQTRTWEGQDGIKRSRTEIVVEQMIMLDRSGNTQSSGSQQFNVGQQQYNQGPSKAPSGSELPTISIDDSMGGDEGGNEIRIEDIPF